MNLGHGWTTVKLSSWFSPLPWFDLAETSDWACLHRLDSSDGLFLCPSSLGLVLLLSHLGPYKMDNNDTHCHGSLTFMDFYG